jgi:hypothetical protein
VKVLSDELGMPQIFATNCPELQAGPGLGGSRADKLHKHSPRRAGMRKLDAWP